MKFLCVILTVTSIFILLCVELITSLLDGHTIRCLSFAFALILSCDADNDGVLREALLYVVVLVGFCPTRRCIILNCELKCCVWLVQRKRKSIYCQSGDTFRDPQSYVFSITCVYFVVKK